MSDSAYTRVEDNAATISNLRVFIDTLLYVSVEMLSLGLVQDFDKL